MGGRSPLSTVTITKSVAVLGLLLLAAVGTWKGSQKLLCDRACHEKQDATDANALSQPLTAQPHLHSLPTVTPKLMDAADSEAGSARRTPSTLQNYTIVTAYFNIGQFSKGSLANKRNSSTYLNWAWPYRLIENGVVAYFDDAHMAAAFTELRRGLPTKVVMVDRSKLWAFTLLNRTRVVFSQPDYPKKNPKSTSPEYVAAMHAKYELLVRAVHEDDTFGSSYIAWMDLGIYRTLPRDANSTFMLRVNPCLHDDAVMYVRIYAMVKGYTVPTVMRNGHDWVGGGFFVARRDVMALFCKEYARRVESYLNNSLANHDQSVLLAMYLPSSLPRPSVPLQAMIPSGSDSPWFYMALLSRRESLEAASDGLRADSGNSASVAHCTYEIYT